MPAFNDYEHVYKPLPLGRTTLRNRIIFSPMVCDYADSIGQPTQGYIDFIEEQARTGVALVNVGASRSIGIPLPTIPLSSTSLRTTRLTGSCFLQTRHIGMARRFRLNLSMQVAAFILGLSRASGP